MSDRSKSWIMLIILALIWGSSFILMKKAMYTESGEHIYTDTQVGALRMVFAALTLLPFAIKGIRQLNSFKKFALLSIVGLCGNFFPSFLFTYAETGISSGYTGMLNSCTPIFAIILGAIIFRDKLTKRQYIGVGIGTTGVILLMLAGQNLSMSGSWMHILAVVLATLCYGISLNVIKHTLQGMKSFEIAALAFFIILIPSIIIAWQQGSLETFQASKQNQLAVIYIIILSVVGTAIALIIFNRMIALSNVLFASSVTYLIPIVAVVIGLGFGEEINIWQILSMLVVISGIFIANGSKSSRTPKKA